MSSWIIRIAAILIGLLLLFVSVQSAQPLVGIVGAAFFLGLAALSIWGRSEAHIFLALALVFAVHPIWGILTGKMSELTRHSSRDILLAKEPEAFWFNVAAATLLALVCLCAAAFSFWRQRRAQPGDQPDLRKKPRRQVS